jgi:hypothetical protein
MRSDCHAWVQVLRGAITINDISLNSSDGAAISDETELKISGVSAAEIMVFELG